jgi:protein-tyrosine-phosphatase
MSLGYPTAELRSKSWDEFAGPGAPKFDLVITVCDAAAGEACPRWPGAPLKAHWGIADPAGAPGGVAAERAAFKIAYDRLLARMTALVALPIETMSAVELRLKLQEIAMLEGATAASEQGQN